MMEKIKIKEIKIIAFIKIIWKSQKLKEPINLLTIKVV